MVAEIRVDAEPDKVQDFNFFLAFGMTPISEIGSFPNGWLPDAFFRNSRLTYIGKEVDKENMLGDFGVRKYNSISGRFNSIDPLWEKYYGWSPYHYCGNDPVNKEDGNGMWHSWVHDNQSKESAIGLGLSDYQIDRLAAGSVAVDEDQVNQWKHLMLGLTIVNNSVSMSDAIEKSKVKLNSFLTNNLQNYIESDDIWHLGQNQHPIQDSFCPSHEGWQVWEGSPKSILGWIWGIVNPFSSNRDLIRKAAIHVIGDEPFFARTKNQAAIDASRKVLMEGMESAETYKNLPIGSTINVNYNDETKVYYTSMVIGL